MQTKGDGFTSFMIGGGISKGEFIEESTKFSGKRLAALAQDPAILARLQEIKAYCLALYQEKHQTEAVAV